ncbi:dihydrolipoamide acetyltransferase component of pyruvate dehydrogenase complex [Sporosarcina sp. NCCP-2222]|uniref:dihydrolipoamide acetyltransferase family protein n=1 Tax=Sporosarcina sp. NCCP-2222 TaxID=2935073 RepID=UPI002084A70F|nr:dihydrolipoamide acetyltransferase family protein [Sporosarcina sp. NCCP-2222]GKV54168.1 dihydrolipoamide acetyltransferase component of pyruvate dehydrogenase complex [Sporosarcina sp. NCCP-2222]
MAIENIEMPKLGESVTEGTIEKWLVKPGDRVNKYDPLAEVNTDKVTAEIPSSFEGTIKEIIVQEGETVEVGVIVCTIEVEGGEASQTAETQTVKEEPAKEMPAAAGSQKPSTPVKREVGKAAGRYSPAVLRLAQENDIDLTLVDGSGKEGRITRKDLMKLIESGQIPTAAAESSSSSSSSSSQVIAEPAKQMSQAAPARTQETVPVAAGDIEIPVSGVRRAIANNMLRSKHEAPHAWTMIEVDVTSLVNYRDSLKAEFKQKEGFNLTYFAFFVKAVAQALKEFPMMNAMWAGDKIVQKKDINISIAVATEDALFVPVIKYADELTIKGIGREINDLASKVRSGKLKSDEMQGGTFTVNNTGSFGSVQSMGIINYPQAAILQVESIVKRPVVMEGGMIGVRDMVNLCLSLDHRVLDGLVAGRFLARVKDILENVTKENTSIY